MHTLNVSTTSEYSEYIAAARRIQSDINGELPGGLSLEIVEEYVIVDDGTDRWIAETSDYERAAEALLKVVCTGDVLFADDGEWYTDLCNSCSCIYSRTAHTTDYRNLEDLEPKDLIYEALGIELDEVE